VVKGLITSSDSFMDDLERVNVVRRQFPGVKAAEMESTAIAQTAWQFGVPFVIIRSLSDIAGSDSLTSYEQFLVQASINSAALVELIIKEMGDFG
jgi:adenosylhomocysteine nucleosidase